MDWLSFLWRHKIPRPTKCPSCLTQLVFDNFDSSIACPSDCQYEVDTGLWITSHYIFNSIGTRITLYFTLDAGYNGFVEVRTFYPGYENPWFPQKPGTTITHYSTATPLEYEVIKSSDEYGSYDTIKNWRIGNVRSTKTVRLEQPLPFSAHKSLYFTPNRLNEWFGQSIQQPINKRMVI